MLSVGASIIVGLAAGIYIPGRDRNRQEIKDKDKMAVEFAPLKNDLLLRAARGTWFVRSFECGWCFVFVLVFFCDHHETMLCWPF